LTGEITQNVGEKLNPLCTGPPSAEKLKGEGVVRICDSATLTLIRSKRSSTVAIRSDTDIVVKIIESSAGILIPIICFIRGFLASLRKLGADRKILVGRTNGSVCTNGTLAERSRDKRHQDKDTKVHHHHRRRRRTSEGD
jgi:hypothetical protein